MLGPIHPMSIYNAGVALYQLVQTAKENKKDLLEMQGIVYCALDGVTKIEAVFESEEPDGTKMQALQQMHAVMEEMIALAQVMTCSAHKRSKRIEGDELRSVFMSLRVYYNYDLSVSCVIGFVGADGTAMGL